ncbi:MAG: ParB/RepB/Spo0J family partition protein [Bacilli bacterium]|nr:ParB/RepB/Spo0J family partition protein [Bacilli bacterium]
MNNNQAIQMINIDSIIPNRFQPRLTFDEQALNELASSIKEHGIIQPIVLRKVGEKYEIIAGERRYKASVLIGLTSVPAIISNLDDNKSAEVALVENVQRRNLTSIEEARSYKKILDKEYLTQEDLAKKLGVTQSTIANKLRLLNLSDSVQEALLNERISERHARSLLQIEDLDSQNSMLNRIISERMTVRQLDAAIKTTLQTEKMQNIENNMNSNPFDITEERLEIKNEETIPQDELNQNIFQDTFQPLNETSLDETIVNNDNLEEQNENKEIETLDFLTEEKSSTTEIEENLFSKSKLLNIFDRQEYPSLEDQEVNLSFDQSSENIFNEKEEHVSTSENKNIFDDLDIPIIEKSTSEEKEIKPIKTNLEIEKVNPRIIPEDLTSVTNSYKELEKEIKEAGFKIISEEFDFEDLYQIIIKIEKQDD